MLVLRAEKGKGRRFSQGELKRVLWVAKNGKFDGVKDRADSLFFIWWAKSGKIG